MKDRTERTAAAPQVGFVSLGCPKALVDSERIISELKMRGYGISPDYSGADLVVVNTCGFIDAAIDESLEAIGEALQQNGRVIVTGCLGVHPDKILSKHDIETIAPGYGCILRGKKTVAKHMQLVDDVLKSLDKSVAVSRYVGRDEER